MVDSYSREYESAARWMFWSSITGKVHASTAPCSRSTPRCCPASRRSRRTSFLRRKQAKEEHWPGDTEGIDSTLAFLRAKQAEAARLAKRPVTDLGIPRPCPADTQ